MLVSNQSTKPFACIAWNSLHTCARVCSRPYISCYVLWILLSHTPSLRPYSLSRFDSCRRPTVRSPRLVNFYLGSLLVSSGSWSFFLLAVVSFTDFWFSYRSFLIITLCQSNRQGSKYWLRVGKWLVRIS